MTKIFMNEKERKIINSVLDNFSGSFWEYGDQEACFKQDAKMMMLLCLRNAK